MTVRKGRVKGLGFRVWGLRFSVCLNRRDQGLGFRIQDLAFSV